MLLVLFDTNNRHRVTIGDSQKRHKLAPNGLPDNNDSSARVLAADAVEIYIGAIF